MQSHVHVSPCHRCFALGFSITGHVIGLGRTRAPEGRGFSPRTGSGLDRLPCYWSWVSDGMGNHTLYDGRTDDVGSIDLTKDMPLFFFLFVSLFFLSLWVHQKQTSV